MSAGGATHAHGCRLSFFLSRPTPATPNLASAGSSRPLSSNWPAAYASSEEQLSADRAQSLAEGYTRVAENYPNGRPSQPAESLQLWEPMRHAAPRKMRTDTKLCRAMVASAAASFKGPLPAGSSGPPGSLLRARRSLLLFSASFRLRQRPSGQLRRRLARHDHNTRARSGGGRGPRELAVSLYYCSIRACLKSCLSAAGLAPGLILSNVKDTTPGSGCCLAEEHREI